MMFLLSLGKLGVEKEDFLWKLVIITEKNLDQIKGPVQYDAMNQEANTVTPRF